MEVRDGYPEPQDNPDDTEGSEGNEGVPTNYLDDVLKDFNKKNPS